MAVLIVGLARAGAEPDGIGDFAGAVPPRNLASGHMSIMSMAQSSAKQATVAPRVDLGAGAGDDHRSHERKNCHALQWTCHNRCRQSFCVILVSRLASL